jgi:hypothetical protein
MRYEEIFNRRDAELTEFGEFSFRIKAFPG